MRAGVLIHPRERSTGSTLYQAVLQLDLSNSKGYCAHIHPQPTWPAAPSWGNFVELIACKAQLLRQGCGNFIQFCTQFSERQNYKIKDRAWAPLEREQKQELLSSLRKNSWGPSLNHGMTTMDLCCCHRKWVSSLTKSKRVEGHQHLLRAYSIPSVDR